MNTDVELTLRRGVRATYQVELRLRGGNDDDEIREVGDLEPAFDPGKLPPLPGDDVAYGKALGAALLHSEDIRTALVKATTLAAADPLRISLFVHPDAQELHAVAWETARHPEGEPLFSGAARIFTRFVATKDIRQMNRRPRGVLRVLVAVASPSDVTTFVDGSDATLAAIDEQVEVSRIVSSLGEAGVVETLVSSKAPVTLNAIIDKLDEDFDVFVLLCHGRLSRGKPAIMLQQDDGTAEWVDGFMLVERMHNELIASRPRLIVLGTCQSAVAAGEPLYGNAGALNALGPMLARSGIPAVLAMQGNISLTTVNQFIPDFLRRVADDGHLDRAVGLARSRVRDTRLDWWVPTLFTRLRSGDIWRRCEFETPERDFAVWADVISAIGNRTCTPILGPALLERHTGTRRELGRRLADHLKLQIPAADSDYLAYMAQQVSVVRKPNTIRRNLLMLLSDMVVERHRRSLPEALLKPLANADFNDEVVSRLASVLDVAVAREGPTEPHRVIAGLKLPVYVTANADGILARCLKSVRNADPVVEIHRWNAELQAEAPPPEHAPTVEKPLVYHFFGAASHLNSVVVSQDQYLDALITAAKAGAIPSAVRGALTKNTLLFLGFHPEDWSFRTLFRFIISQEGSHLLSKNVHVAVQIDPNEQSMEDPRWARRYLAKYLDSEMKMSIFWGSVADFVSQLQAKL